MRSKGKTRSNRGLARFASVSLVLALTLGGLSLSPRSAAAGEEDDLQRQIETQRAGVNDLDRLDDARATTDEITLLRAWLDEAWNLRSKHEYDQVREVLDRCISQAELVRQKISAARLRAQVQKRDATVNELRAKIAATKKALQETQVKKQALEEPKT
jgi:hypothetical protein